MCDQLFFLSFYAPGKILQKKLSSKLIAILDLTTDSVHQDMLNVTL